MIWIFVRRDYGALQCANLAGRSGLLKGMTTVYTTTDGRHRHKALPLELKAEVLAQPLA
jgi:hypothetical protein